nr:PREDICTED: tetratricopeptide repeat protein 25 [Bemisia tabaci]
MGDEVGAEPEAGKTTENERVRGILHGNTRDQEFLQSFLRVDAGDEADQDVAEKPDKKNVKLRTGKEVKRPLPDTPPAPDEKARGGKGAQRGGSPPPTAPHGTLTFVQLTKDLKLRQKQGQANKVRVRGKRVRVRRQEEVYTDKDRAAAVNMGSRDIKQSLKMKRRADRSKALQIPEEAEPGTLLALGNYELRNGDVAIAINFVNKALELNPNDKQALAARSKCYLLLGEPKLALSDAETALSIDKNFIKAIFQKGEALYHLGNFEHSLMFYHRGLKIRPEMEDFRLGVQKAQEAIENTIGKMGAVLDLENPSRGPTSNRSSNVPGTGGKPPSNLSARKITGGTTATRQEIENRKTTRRLLGELCLDKEYLENLLNHPDLICLHQSGKNHIGQLAQEGVAFLTNRQEFWRQQRPNTSKK